MRNRDLSWGIISTEHLFHPPAALFLSILLSFPGSLPCPLTFVGHIHYLILCLRCTVSTEPLPRPVLSPCERLNREAGCRRLCGPARYPPPCSLLAFHIARLFSYRDAIKTPLTVKYVCVFNLFETFCFFSWINKLTDK